MSSFDESMKKIFNIDIPENSFPEIQKKNVPTVIPNMNLEDDLAFAYDKTKTNLEEIIEQGKTAMKDMLAIAKESDHPRAFEVYGTLLKNVVDANKELISVQKQMREISGANKQQGNTKIDKAIFIGSTAELSQLLKGDKPK